MGVFSRFRRKATPEAPSEETNAAPVTAEAPAEGAAEAVSDAASETAREAAPRRRRPR